MTKKKSADIHQLHDNPSNLRDLDKRDVKPEPIVPAMPTGMSKQGRAIWKYLAPELEKSALLTRRDRESFRFLCEEAAIAQVALQRCRGPKNDYSELTEIDPSHQNRIRRNPAWIIYTQAITSFRIWAREFGLTPTARIGLYIGNGVGIPAPDRGAEEEDAELFA